MNQPFNSFNHAMATLRRHAKGGKVSIHSAEHHQILLADMIIGPEAQAAINEINRLGWVYVSRGCGNAPDRYRDL